MSRFMDRWIRPIMLVCLAIALWACWMNLQP